MCSFFSAQKNESLPSDKRRCANASLCQRGERVRRLFSRSAPFSLHSAELFSPHRAKLCSVRMVGGSARRDVVAHRHGGGRGAAAAGVRSVRERIAHVELPHAGEAAGRPQTEQGDHPVHPFTVQGIAGVTFAARASLFNGKRAQLAHSRGRYQGVDPRGRQSLRRNL